MIAAAFFIPTNLIQQNVFNAFNIIVQDQMILRYKINNRKLLFHLFVFL